VAHRFAFITVSTQTYISPKFSDEINIPHNVIRILTSSWIQHSIGTEILLMLCSRPTSGLVQFLMMSVLHI